MIESKLLTIKEVCKKVDLSRQRIYILIKKKRFPNWSEKQKCRVFWSQKDVNIFLERRAALNELP